MCTCVWVYVCVGIRQTKENHNGNNVAFKANAHTEELPSPQKTCPLPIPTRRAPNTVTHGPYGTAWAMWRFLNTWKIQFLLYHSPLTFRDNVPIAEDLH